MYSKTLLITLISFFTVHVSAQLQELPKDFIEVDKYAITVKYRKDINKLAQDLTSPYTSDLKKVRSIFTWITENIRYDYKFINKGYDINAPECAFADNYECINSIRRWEKGYLNKILKRRKAVADGYARLFKKLCNINYIQCEFIQGYARTKPYQVGNSMSVNHAWNAVMIYGIWYYVDPAWAAGYCLEDDETGSLVQYVKHYNDYYWLRDFKSFSRNHFPKKGNFLEITNLSKEQFFMTPHYYSTTILDNLTEISPLTGVLKVKKGDTIHFKFEYKKSIELLQINSNIFRNPSLWKTVPAGKRKTKTVKDEWAEKKQQYVPFQRVGNLYSFDYVVKENSLYYLELIFDKTQAIRYRVRVEEQSYR